MSIDRIKPLKYETPELGTQNNRRFQTETDPNEDYVAAKGLSFEGLISHTAEKIGQILKFKIPDYDLLYTYSNDFISKVEMRIGTDIIAEINLTYVNDFITVQEVEIFGGTNFESTLRTLKWEFTYSQDRVTEVNFTEF